MGAPSKRAKKTRAASEFDAARLRGQLAFPRENGNVYAWSLAEIYSARDAQMRGQFTLAARLAESMRTDDALFVAFQNRLAPQRALSVEMVPAPKGKGEAIAKEADALFGDQGVGLHPDTIVDIHGCLVNHGVAFGFNTWTTREDGTRTDVEHRYWPIEFVRWDAFLRCFMARLDPTSTANATDLTAGGEIPIVHGDGRWVIYRAAEYQPWKYGVLLAAALVWARHAFAMRDWSKSSLAHGLAKVIGELPEGVPLQTEGGLSEEARAFQELLLAIAQSDLPIGIRPAGSKTDFITNSSAAWQIFTNLAENAEKAAARIYLGTDGTLGAQGGAPGVDISELFGVASTLIQGDLDALSRGLKTGMIDPWCAVNFGVSDLAPTRRYMLPDADAEALKKSLGERTAAFSAALKGRVDARIPLTQADVDGLAADFGVRAPKLPVAPVAEPSTTAPAAPALRRSA